LANSIVVGGVRITKEEIVQIFPSVLIEAGEGDITPISLQWYEANHESVEFIAYAISFHTKNQGRVDVKFESFEAMMKSLSELGFL
jgi:hypothetical protein